MDLPTSPGPPADPSGAQPTISSDPAQLADDLVADEQALRDPATPEPALAPPRAASRRPTEPSGATRNGTSSVPRIPRGCRDLRPQRRRPASAVPDDRSERHCPRLADRGARSGGRAVGPLPRSRGGSGVPWNYLAAIHLIETRFGSIEGTSTAGAQGPMQFLPSTFEAYGDGGDIHSLRDSIMADRGATSPRMTSPLTAITPSSPVQQLRPVRASGQ